MPGVRGDLHTGAHAHAKVCPSGGPVSFPETDKCGPWLKVSSHWGMESPGTVGAA